MASNNKNKTYLAILALALLALMVYIYPHPTVSHYRYEQGKPWTYADLYAPFDIDVYLDSATMEQKVDSVNKNFVPFYSPVAVNSDSIVNLAIRQLNAVPDSLAVGSDFLAVPDRKRFAVKVRQIISNAYARGVIPDQDIAEGQFAFRRQLSPTEVRRDSTSNYFSPKSIFQALDKESAAYNCHTLLFNSGLNSILQPSLLYNSSLSESKLAEEKAKFTSSQDRIIAGGKIIGKGETVTAQVYANLRNYERILVEQSGQSSRSDLLMTIGQTLYIALLLALFILYIFIYEPKVFASFKTMVFILGMTTLFFVAELIVSWLVSSDVGFYLVPLAVVPILISVFFNGRLAMASGAYLIMLCAALTKYPIEFIFVQSTAMIAGVLSLRELTQRSQLLRTSAVVTATLIVAYLALTVMTNGSFDDFSWRMVGGLAVAGALTAMAYILMSLIERMFGFISNVTLVELADTNTPLLRQLSDDCPGTFQHSVAVANLAGDAARLIGANVLLTRAGALYHDIGKLTNPVFYTENQHGVNPHDGLSPLKSAEIIISHVSEGLKRADRAGLPAVIKDFIAQHHGAGKAKYFYFTYCKQHPDENVDPAPFTYPGPNPSSREASVLMMADSVEAASRSLTEHTPQAIRSLVDKIIDSQIADGLHNESSLSFRDVQTIKDAFTRRLMTIYHSRIAYPDAPKNAAPAASHSSSSPSSPTAPAFPSPSSSRPGGPGM